MKKTSSKSRPLSLKRETVRVLAASQLESAHGGAGSVVRDLTGGDSDCVVCLIIPRLPPPGSLSGVFGGCGTVPPPGSGVINPLYP